jgi:hypothetical protein
MAFRKVDIVSSNLACVYIQSKSNRAAIFLEARVNQSVEIAEQSEE